MRGRLIALLLIAVSLTSLAVWTLGVTDTWRRFTATALLLCAGITFHAWMHERERP